ncbi:MAG: thioredoxin domain-containing protein [Patescibacteria group bacterium]
MSDKNLIIIVLGVLVVIGAALYMVSGPNWGGETSSDGGRIAVTASSSPTAQFAQCLKDKGVIFYGAFWCSHCKTQKALFGDAAALLPYVECSTPDGRAQLEACKDKKVEGYPTWEFPDGSRLSGERTFAELGEKANCQAPPVK